MMMIHLMVKGPYFNIIFKEANILLPSFSDDFLETLPAKEIPIKCHKCGCNHMRLLLGHECRAIKPPKPAATSSKLFKQSSSDHIEKEVFPLLIPII